MLILLVVIEFIIEIGIKVDPRLLYTTDEMGRTIFSYTVLHRQMIWIHQGTLFCTWQQCWNLPVRSTTYP
jgi:hypothetical protein